MSSAVTFVQGRFSACVPSVPALGAAQLELLPELCLCCGQTPTSTKTSKENGRRRPLLSFSLETQGSSWGCHGWRAEMLLVRVAQQPGVQRTAVPLKMPRAGLFGFSLTDLSISLLGGVLHLRFES